VGESACVCVSVCVCRMVKGDNVQQLLGKQEVLEAGTGACLGWWADICSFRDRKCCTHVKCVCV